MTPLEDFTGRTFGRLTIVGEAAERGSGWSRRMICRCDCGVEKVVRLRNLKSGQVRSCGGHRGRHHHSGGHNRSPEYNAWVSMNQRCVNPKNPRFQSYGGRGVTVCAAWRESFEAFFQDMGPRPSAQHSIDRKDNDLGYAPGNCRWATRTEQQNNRRASSLFKRRSDAGKPRSRQ